jgi:hemerythrin
MAFMDWSEALDVGVPSIDAQHKQLVERLTRIEEGRKQAVPFEVMLPMLNDFYQHALEHFRYEEKLFVQYGFQEAERHKTVHNDLERLFLAFMEEYKADPEGIMSPAFINTVRRWLMNHITGEDKRMGAFLAGKGVN